MFECAKQMSMSIRWAFCTKKWSPTKSEWMCGLSCTQEEERERIMKFVYKKDAKSALVGRLLLRKVITEQTGIPYSEINLGRTEKGKPYLIDPRSNRLHFNISHQGDYVVLAADSCKVGIDIMKTEIKGNQTISELFHTMRRQCTSYEWQTIKGQPTERRQLEMFLRHWCLKESYVKALGVGIGFAKKLQSIEFHITEQSIELNKKIVARDTKMFLENKALEQWCFEESKLDEDHQVAVALENSNSSQVKNMVQSGFFSLLTITDLVSSAISFCHLDGQLWKEFESKRESPWEK